jgi:hypothetical protein
MCALYTAHSTRLDTLPEQRAQGKKWLGGNSLGN